MSDARPPLSPRKLAANRAKARKSTGPRTAAGKAASACNAYQHGLTGESLALPPDLADAVQAKQAAYEATLRPRNGTAWRGQTEFQANLKLGLTPGPRVERALQR